MSPFFLLNNFHFAVELFGALAFLMVSWLAFDAFLIRRDFLTASRGIGFALLAVATVVHASGFAADAWGYVAWALYLVGLLVVAANLVLERPVERPTFKAIVVLPAFSVLLPYLNILLAILSGLITYAAFRQYTLELKKTLRPFWMGFLFLSLGWALSIFYRPDSLSVFWVIGHLAELAGFGWLVWWVWQYLQLRIREEMVLVFVSFSLLISIIVTLAFSTILIRQIESETTTGLLTDAKVLDFAVTRLREEASAKAKLLASRSDIADALVQSDFARLETLLTRSLEGENLGFLTVLDRNGDVVLRAHALTQREDNLSGERAVGQALAGKDFVTVESSPAEKFSIRAASPLKRGERVVGAIVAGFGFDNALVDNMKRLTGLDASILEGNLVVATTLFNPDRRTRSVGVKQTDRRVEEAVLARGEPIVLRTEILSRPFLASYLPIINADQKVVGMISSAKPQQEILTLLNATNRLTLFTVVILMLVLALPTYFVTKRLLGEVT